ncbi:unnamed protein product [Mytilus coruscus]|uniref:Uncharacterized protein n=1 Tax=Mytilus coruscus TaxID=42192 RepID=A0A6J8ENQ0_MYTCO|nr:unnamed protein product [Mytilus coruscus]
MIDNHYDKEIKIQAIEGRLVRTLNFKIIPEVCREDGRTISAYSNSKTIHVSKPSFIPKDSPLKKIIKLSNDATQNTNETNDIDIHNISETDTNIAKNSDGISVLPVENSNDNGMEDDDETLQEMMSLLPGAIHTLKECGKLNEFISFNRMLSEKKFPLDNIAFLLFLDVVR